jgi:hypothetical protein
MLRLGLRRMATAAAAAPAPAPAASVGKVSLANLEARWASLPQGEREAARQQLSQLMKGDWKKLAAEEKAASTLAPPLPPKARAPTEPAHAHGPGYFVAYGHTVQPASDTAQVAGGVVASIILGFALVFGIRLVTGASLRFCTQPCPYTLRAGCAC